MMPLKNPHIAPDPKWLPTPGLKDDDGGVINELPWPRESSRIVPMTVYMCVFE